MDIKPKPHLLAIPLALRRKIYRKLLRNAYIIDIVAGDMTRVPEPGLFLTCRQLHQEAREFYYRVNIFQLTLSDPTYSPKNYLHGVEKFQKYIGPIQILHLEIGTMVEGRHPGHMTGSYVMSEDAVREWDWFIKQLVAIKTPKMVPGDKWFKELVVIFRRPQPPVTNVADKRRRRNPAVMPSWMDAQEERDRNKALEPLVMPFKPAIVRISILLLSDFDWTALVPVGHKKIYWISGTPAIVYGKRGGILQTLSVVGPIPKF